MKHLKKIMAWTLVIAMVFTGMMAFMPTKAQAAVPSGAGTDYTVQGSSDDEWTDPSGTGTYKNTTTTTKLDVTLQGNASINGVKVSAYSILSANTETSTGVYSYEINSAFQKFFDTQFPDAFEGEHINASEVLTELGNLTSAEQKQQFSVALNQYIKTNSIVATDAQTGTADSNTLTLDISRRYSTANGYYGGKGYYLVVRGDDMDDYYTLKTLTAATNTLTLKGSKPTLVKTGDKSVVEAGETVTYTLTTKMVNTQANSTYKYVVRDQLEKGLTYTADSMAVTVGDTTLVKDTDYTITAEESGDGNYTDITVTFKFDEGSQLKNDAYLGKAVVLTYTATLNVNATTGNNTGNENYNKAWLEYGSSQTTESEWDVYSLALEINKQNTAGQALAGAIFTIANSTAPETPLRFVKDETVGAEGYYYLTTDNSKGQTTITTDENGHFYINGLKDGSYVVTETTAPSGYSKIDAVTVTVATTVDNGTKALTALDTTLSDPSFTTLTSAVGTGLISLEITDPTEGSANLPGTGGIGRTIVYVIGSLVLIGGCATLVITRTRRKEA